MTTEIPESGPDSDRRAADHANTAKRLVAWQNTAAELGREAEADRQLARELLAELERCALNGDLEDTDDIRLPDLNVIEKARAALGGTS